jgi:hypothetical protein
MNKRETTNWPYWPSGIKCLFFRAEHVVREKGNELLAKSFLDHLVFSSIPFSLNAAIQMYLQPVQYSLYPY